MEVPEDSKIYKNAKAYLGKVSTDLLDKVDGVFTFTAADEDKEVAQNVTVEGISFAAVTVTYTQDAHVTAVKVKKAEETDYKALVGETDSATEGTAYSFTVDTAAGYRVKSVTVTEADGEADERSAADSYDLTIGTKNIAVAIETELDPAKANSVTFTFANATVSVGAEQIESGKPYLTTAKTVSYTVTAAKGYKIEVAEEGKDKEYKDTISGTVTFDNAITGAEGETVGNETVAITTIAENAKTDRYFKVLNSNNNLKFATENAEVVASSNSYDTYKVAKETAVVEFTLTVPYGYTVSTSADYIQIDSEPQKDGRFYVYKGHFAANQIIAEDAETASVLGFTSTQTPAVITFKGDRPAEVNVNGYSCSLTSAPNGYTLGVNVGDTVIIKLADDQTLTEVIGKTKTERKTDSYRKYKFTVEDATTFEITNTLIVNKSYDLLIKDAEGVFAAQTSAVDADYVKNKAFTFAIAESGKSSKLDIERAELKGGSKSAATPAKADKSDEANNIVNVSIDKEDAGKTLTLDLYYKEKSEIDGTTTVVKAATATIKVEAVPTVTVAGIKKSGDTVKLDANTVTKYDLEGSNLDHIKAVTAKGGKVKADVKVVNGAKQLEITTPSEETTNEEVSIVYDRDEKNVVFTIKVTTIIPNLKLAKFDSPAQGANDVSVVLTKDKNVKESADGKLYYEVRVDVTGDKTPAGSLTEKAYYFPVDGSDSVAARIKVNSAKTAEAEGKYKLTARIVLVKGGVTASAIDTKTGYYTKESSPVSDSNIVKAGKEITKTVSTRNDYYEDKLGLTKKTTTVYNGTDDKVVAVVKYSGKASHIDELSAQVYDTNGVPVYGNISADADKVSGEVHVRTSGQVKPGKYDVVVTAEGVKDKGGADTMYRATAKVTVTVVQGIISVYHANSVKIRVNSKKDVTYTFKPTFSGRSWDGKYYEPKTKKVSYELY